MEALLVGRGMARLLETRPRLTRLRGTGARTAALQVNSGYRNLVPLRTFARGLKRRTSGGCRSVDSEGRFGHRAGPCYDVAPGMKLAINT